MPVTVMLEVLHVIRAQIVCFANRERVCADSPCYMSTGTNMGRLLMVVNVPWWLDHDGAGRKEAYWFQQRVKCCQSCRP